MINVFFLGPAKTFSEQAAQKLASNRPAGGNATPLPNFEAIARAVAHAADADGSVGVLPYYNFLEGLVQESVDLIYEYRLNIIDATRVLIEFAIGGTASAERPVIYSHPKALAQCSDFIQENFPTATIKAVSSTAEAARTVQSSGVGLAIASPSALTEYGIAVRSGDIGNKRHGRRNFTDFLLVSKVRQQAPNGGALRSMVVVVPKEDRAGLLAGLLAEFAKEDLNVAKIHSRPALEPASTGPEPQMFYLEVMCAGDDERLTRCRSSINRRLDMAAGPESCTVLGSFPELKAS